MKYSLDHEYFVHLKLSKMKLFPKIRDFLESSTIHGLVHISTGKNVFIRCIWGMIVVACFSCGIYMIESAVESWVDNPVVTSVDTKAIEQVLRSAFISPHTILTLDRYTCQKSQFVLLRAPTLP